MLHLILNPLWDQVHPSVSCGNILQQTDVFLARPVLNPYNDAFALAFLSREMESVERTQVIDKLERIRNKKKYKEIISQKHLNAPEKE